MWGGGRREEGDRPPVEQTDGWTVGTEGRNQRAECGRKVVSMDRRKFVIAGAAAGLAAATSRTVAEAPNVILKKRARPMVISDHSGIAYTNGGPQSAVEKAFEMIVGDSDVLDALIAGVNIPELDPTESGIGYGGLPNERGVVQLDSCCMHGPKRKAGGVAALEGVRTPSRGARAVRE